MKVTAITKFKHGAIWAVLKQLGWSLKDLSRESGLTYNVTGNIVNLIKRPSASQANSIQAAFGKAGVYFDPTDEWPEAFKGTGKRIMVEQTKDVASLELEAASLFYQSLPDKEPEFDAEEIIPELLSVLDDREKAVVAQNFGVGTETKTLARLGQDYRVCTQRIIQIKSKGLRKMRKAFERRRAFEAALE